MVSGGEAKEPVGATFGDGSTLPVLWDFMRSSFGLESMTTWTMAWMGIGRLIEFNILVEVDRKVHSEVLRSIFKKISTFSGRLPSYLFFHDQEAIFWV